VGRSSVAGWYADFGVIAKDDKPTGRIIAFLLLHRKKQGNNMRKDVPIVADMRKYGLFKHGAGKIRKI
jgi:hypothetical protein